MEQSQICEKWAFFRDTLCLGPSCCRLEVVLKCVAYVLIANVTGNHYITSNRVP